MNIYREKCVWWIRRVGVSNEADKMMTATTTAMNPLRRRGGRNNTSRKSVAVPITGRKTPAVPAEYAVCRVGCLLMLSLV